MRKSAPLLVTADNNYAVGKVRNFGDAYSLLGFYQVISGHYIRVKVSIWDGCAVPMNQEEVYEFPENYEFHIPHFPGYPL